MKTAFLRSALLALAGLFAAAAPAQESYPSKPVRIVVPYPAGGVADLLPRTVGQKLSEKWKQPVIVENKPGASGNIGMAEGARAEPDGHTLVLAPTGNLTVNQFLFKDLPFDVSKDFAPVTVLATSPNVLVVHPSVPAKTFRELLAYAKANPGKLNFSSPGTGSGAHLAGELLNVEAGIQAVHVPYKGMAPAVSDLVGGQVQMMFAGISTALPHIRAGKLVALAIASPRRSPQLPDVPTVAESGIPGFDVTSWYGIVVRAGTPPDVVKKLHADMSEALAAADVKDKLGALGLDPLGNSPEEFQRMIASESRKWSEIVRKANIKPQQ
jgi:tripartite-type tricarboxylate transporter receptor subunit TctC